MNYKEAAIKLWELLDDIDTASDQAKDNDQAYRHYVEKRQSERFKIMTSDGYDLYDPESGEKIT